MKRNENTINLISSENRRSLRVIERWLQSSVEIFSNLDWSGLVCGTERLLICATFSAWNLMEANASRVFSRIQQAWCNFLRSTWICWLKEKLTSNSLKVFGRDIFASWTAINKFVQYYCLIRELRHQFGKLVRHVIKILSPICHCSGKVSYVKAHRMCCLVEFEPS